MAAAISYYLLFALGPLAMFLVSSFGLVAGSDDSQQSLADEVTDYLEVGAGEPILELNDDAFVRIEEQYGRVGLAEIEEELTNLNQSGDSDERRGRLPMRSSLATRSPWRSVNSNRKTCPQARTTLSLTRWTTCRRRACL